MRLLQGYTTHDRGITRGENIHDQGMQTTRDLGVDSEHHTRPEPIEQIEHAGLQQDQGYGLFDHMGASWGDLRAL